MLKQLAKASRKRREGPSLQRFKRTGKLFKHRATPNVHYTSHTLPSAKRATRAFRKLNRCVKKQLRVVETHSAVRKPSSALYRHYVVQHGKHRFHDDVELVLDGRAILIRSSSREGLYDMGVNGKRVETLQRCAKL